MTVATQSLKILRSNTTALTAGVSTLAEGVLAVTILPAGKKFYVGDFSNVAQEIAGDSYAKLASPTFTGTPAAPTATLGTDSTQVATTAFVQAAITAVNKNLSFKEAARVKSDAAVTLGAVVTVADFDGEAQGVTLEEGDRVLLTQQGDDSENGIYVVGVVTDGEAMLTRASDFNTADNIKPNSVLWVSEGTYAGKEYVLTTDGPIVVGDTSLTFVQHGTSSSYTFGDGVDLTGSTVNVVVSDFAGTGLESDGTNNLRLAAQGNGLLGGAGTILSVKPNEAIAVSSDGVSVKFDNTSLTLNGDNQLKVGTVDCGTF